ncbi:uncharacterized protein DFL_007664 [Arthrobotrys flagrans]|uniref:Uncharacterized protein n=1 Tax=Arthrobotrys flagrans TaxID=97331 RepID=A0A436ZWE4_ARTFL|nr:hypothetical protein DFL_007664 [Arthrobotrys flagrans]
MDISIILNAVKPKPSNSPKQGARLHDHTIHFGHGIIKYRQDIARWHWAILEKLKPYYHPGNGTAEAEIIERNVVHLIEDVWIKYYARNEDKPRSKKRTIDEVQKTEGEEGKESFTRKRPARAVSLKETALSFKLDWDSTDKNVAVSKNLDDDVMMAESENPPANSKYGGFKEDNEDESSDKKENQRPIGSSHSFRKKFLRKLWLAARAA